jgi:hypothetical protein
MVNGFLKATDINNFNNYKSVMSQIKIKKNLPSPADIKTASFYLSSSVSPVNEQRFNLTGGFVTPMGNTFGRLFSHKESIATSPFMNQRLNNQRVGTAANFSQTPKPNTMGNNGLGRGNTAA